MENLIYFLKYGVDQTIYFPLRKRGVQDLAKAADYSAYSADVYRSIDGGALAQTSYIPVTVGVAASVIWGLRFNPAELNGKCIVVQIVDTHDSPKAIEDTLLTVYTYGNASANFPTDLGAAILPVNTTQVGGTVQTARDIGASVLLSAGTGTGQLDFTSGVVKANLVQILGTALTETAGYLAAGFKKFFNVATPAHTVGSVDQTGDSYARLGAPAGVSIEADIAAVKADTAAIKNKTDGLPAVWCSPSTTRQ